MPCEKIKSSGTPHNAVCTPPMLHLKGHKRLHSHQTNRQCKEPRLYFSHIPPHCRALSRAWHMQPHVVQTATIAPQSHTPARSKPKKVKANKWVPGPGTADQTSYHWTTCLSWQTRRGYPRDFFSTLHDCPVVVSSSYIVRTGKKSNPGGGEGGGQGKRTLCERSAKHGGGKQS